MESYNVILEAQRADRIHAKNDTLVGVVFCVQQEFNESRNKSRGGECRAAFENRAFYLFKRSVASATASKSASWNGLPIHWRPTGSPPAIPHGTLTPGRPARFKLTV